MVQIVDFIGDWGGGGGRTVEPGSPDAISDNAIGTPIIIGRKSPRKKTRNSIIYSTQ